MSSFNEIFGSTAGIVGRVTAIIVLFGKLHEGDSNPMGAAQLLNAQSRRDSRQLEAATSCYRNFLRTSSTPHRTPPRLRHGGSRAVNRTQNRRPSAEIHAGNPQKRSQNSPWLSSPPPPPPSPVVVADGVCWRQSAPTRPHDNEGRRRSAGAPVKSFAGSPGRRRSPEAITPVGAGRPVSSPHAPLALIRRSESARPLRRPCRRRRAIGETADRRRPPVAAKRAPRLPLKSR